MQPNGLPSHPGWYPDPYDSERVRWFDGSLWTTHAVSSTELNPDGVVQRQFDPRSPEEQRQSEWENQFPWWDTAVKRGTEPPFIGPKGFIIGGQSGRLAARMAERQKNLPIRTAGWLLILSCLLALLACADPVHRFTFIVIAVTATLASLGFKIRERRAELHWKQVGQDR